jgi:hypothetical protein
MPPSSGRKERAHYIAEEGGGREGNRSQGTGVSNQRNEYIYIYKKKGTGLNFVTFTEFHFYEG